MDSQAARQNMVEGQIRPNRVTDPRLVEAMETTPREIFLPDALKGVAYVDDNLKLGDGREALSPMVAARMVQAANLQPTDVALVLGAADGYTTALIGMLSSVVFALESNSGLADKAAAALESLDLSTVTVLKKSLKDGHAEEAPYDVIFINGAVPEIPDVIKQQLAEGGRLVAIKAGAAGWGRIVVMQRVGDVVSQARELLDATAPVLPGFEKEAEFSL